MRLVLPDIEEKPETSHLDYYIGSEIIQNMLNHTRSLQVYCKMASYKPFLTNRGLEEANKQTFFESQSPGIRPSQFQTKPFHCLGLALDTSQVLDLAKGHEAS